MFRDQERVKRPEMPYCRTVYKYKINIGSKIQDQVDFSFTFGVYFKILDVRALTSFSKE